MNGDLRENLAPPEVKKYTQHIPPQVLMSDEDLPPQTVSASRARTQALQREMDTMRRDITTLGARITSIGATIANIAERIIPLFGKEGEGATIAELRAERATLEAQQGEMKAQQTKLEALLTRLEDEGTGRSRGGESQLKKLCHARDNVNDHVMFVNQVLMEHRLDFSHSGVIQLGRHLWGPFGKQDFLINREFEIGKKLALDYIQNCESNRESVIVAGSKGIGKSCLGLVIVNTLLEKEKIVVYEFNDIQMLLVPSEAALGVFKTFRKLFDSYSFEMVGEVGLYRLDDQKDPKFFNDLCKVVNLVHVVDVGDMPAGAIDAYHRQIVISSPNSEKLKRFGEVNSNATYVIYPPWTWEQILEMNSALGDERPTKQVDESILKLKFDLFGGIPRRIFVNETVDEAMRSVEIAVDAVPFEIWKAVFCAEQYTDIPGQVPGLFVAITQSDVPGKKPKVMFSSECIAQHVIRHFVHSRRLELMTLLNAVDGPPRMIRAMQGYLLGEVMHRALLSPKPKKYQLLDLEARGPPVRPRDVEFPMLRERTFSRMDMSDIGEKMEENVYFRPTFPNFTSVESFAIVKKSVLFKKERGLCLVAFQATVSDDHPMKRSGLEEIQKKVAASSDVRKLDVYVVFVTNEGKGISKRQKLGEVYQKLDANYRQCVLYGMELGEVVMKSSMAALSTSSS